MVENIRSNIQKTCYSGRQVIHSKGFVLQRLVLEILWSVGRKFKEK